MSQIHFEIDETDYVDGYVVVFNHITINKDISDAAYRLLVYLHSNSPTWKVYGRFTAQLLGWGKEKLGKAIRDLYNLGFIQRVQTREKGQWGHFIYKVSFKQKFKNEAWAAPKKRERKPKLYANVDEISPNTGGISADAIQPEHGLPAPVVPPPVNRPLPMPNKPMPNLEALKKALPSSSKSSRALEPSAVRGRKFKRSEDKEDLFQWLLGLRILDEKGEINEDSLSYLAHTYSRKKLEDTYYHLVYKMENKGVKIKRSPIALFRYLLENEHSCVTPDSELNEAFARKFSFELGWGSLDFKEKYVIDKNNSAKDISFNMNPAAFRECLGNLYMSLNSNYGT